MQSEYNKHPSSYRDPSGFVFEKENVLYRQVNKSFKHHFEHFINSGCYNHFVKKGWLLPHQTCNNNITGDPEQYITLQPERVNLISYPYEWSFDMLKDAALLTLKLLKEGIGYGIVLKDATPYNIQWHKGKLIFIDTLSFEKYEETKPWIAYRQFCENFVCPLLLMHYTQKPLHSLLLAYPEGIPLQLTRSLLPFRSRFSIHTYLHIHLHASLSKKVSPVNKTEKSFSKRKLLTLADSLESLIQKTKTPPGENIWNNYYQEATQRQNYLSQKKEIINVWLTELNKEINSAIDFGANEGEFSQLLVQHNIRTIATDFSADCINTLYHNIKKSGERNIQPLITDLANPSPDNGVLSAERSSFLHRVQADTGLALALIHHLVIGKNIPFEKTAVLFNKTCNYLIIEWVPKNDEKIIFMLSQKPDVYTHYSEAEFIIAFEKYFSVIKKQPVSDSERILYLMKRK